MTPLTNNNFSPTSTPIPAASVAGKPAPEKDAQLALTMPQTESSKVTLSNEGKALLIALQQIEKEAEQATETGEETTSKKLESFAHGAMGLEHPDTFEKEEDGVYTAGKYLKGALSAGALLLALV